MVNPKLKIAFKIGGSCLFIGYLSYKVDISAIAAAIQQVDLSFYLLSTLITLVSNIFIALKYHLLIKDSRIDHSLISMAKINLISNFYALFLPSAVGREFIRWVKVTRNQIDRASFVATIVFERVSFLLVLMLCGTIPLLMHGSIPEIVALGSHLLPWLILALAAIAMVLSFYASSAVRSLAKSTIDRLLERFSNKSDKIPLIQKFTPHKMTPAVFAAVIGLSLVWQLFYIGRLYALVKAAAVPMDLIDMVWMGSLVLMLQTLPISFAGIGLREGAYAYLFSLYGLAPEKGILIGILFFSQMLIVAITGGVFELTET